METRKMTVGKALQRKNTIIRMIEGDRKKGKESILNDMAFISLKRTVGSKDIMGNVAADMKVHVEANYNKVSDLIKEYTLIDSAIKQSNATTKIKVDGKEYTVAEAFETQKSYGKLSELFIKELRKQYKNALAKYQQSDAETQRKISDKTEVYIGREGKISDDELKRIKETEERNQLEYIDPVGLKEKITKLEEEREAFMQDVNGAINASNAVVEITITI